MLPPPPRRRERWWLHVTLLVVTFGTMTWVGTMYAPALDPEAFRDPASVTLVSVLAASALWYALPLLLILLAHEMGHYLTCRRYGIDASPPFFIPFPSLFGTMGAFIRIREPMREKRQVFDIGVAGPIAGFVVTVPFLVYGILHTHPSPEAGTQSGTLLFAYPPLVTLLQKALLGHTFDSRHVFEHPTFMAAWGGLFVTMFNLIPLGQLDGGHALYAVAGRRQRVLMIPLLLGLVALGFRFPTWWVLGALVLFFGARHPRVLDEEAPLGTARLLVAAGTLAIFALCFLPVPVVESSAPLRPPRERGGTLVHQLDLHRRAEDPGRHRDSIGPERGHVLVEQGTREVRLGGAIETGPPAS
jgi:membrane-associated protease RseP (regulator of RpoE activity)